KEEEKPKDKVKKEELISSKEISAVVSLKSFESTLDVKGSILEKTKESEMASVREPELQEVSCDFSLVKQRTEKIGIGVIFERKQAAKKKDEPEDDKKGEDENITLVDVADVVNIKPEKALKKKKKTKKRDKVEIKVVTPEEDDTSLRPPPKAEHLGINVSRKRTASGTHDIHVDIDIEAGEESAQTDAVVDLNFFDYEESDLSLCEPVEDTIEADVLLDSVGQEDGVDAFAQMNATQEVTTTVQMPSAVSTISRLIEEDKLPTSAEAEICIDILKNKLKVRKRIGRHAEIDLDMMEDEEVAEEQAMVKHPESVKLTDLEQKAVLTCLTKRPIINASWFKNGMVISSNDYIDIEIDGNETRLILNKFIPFYIGTYHVVVDDVGSSPAQLSANIPPQLKNQVPPVITHQIGKPFDLHLNYTAYPTPQIKLLHQGQLMTLETDIDQYDDSVSIRVKNLKEKDEGEFVVILSNEFGKTEVSFQLKLVNTPLAPKDARRTRLTPTTVTVEWDAPQADESDIIHYIVERRTAESGRWRKLAKTTTKEYTCSELVPKEFYAFRIRAVNKFGEGLPSNVVEVDMPDEEEEQLEESFDLETILKMPDGTETADEEVVEAIIE
ncbi:fibronectin type III domain protein, partial [Cooperia oncophora]